ncbi:MAG: hypothetical protein EOM77_02120 [Bacteroidia bacterium]|nr:hypothetical protein [Bacteroidia bacterium]
MTTRGMKKWRPFASLEEQKPSLQQMKHEKGKVSKPLISSEQAEKIDGCLHDFHNRLFKITFYDSGYVLDVEEPILQVDCLNRQIRTDNRVISFNNLLDLEIIQ